MGPGFGPPNPEMINKLKEPKPKTIKEVPKYLKNVFGGTFSRLFYIFKLVWEAKPLLLFVMIFMTIYNGVMPLVGTLIASNLLGKVVLRFIYPETDLILPLLLQFGYIFVNSLIHSVQHMIMQISREVVTNHVKLKIINKARDVDLASFDMPDFYERLENANREAGSRPVNILNSAFDMISKVISMVSYIVVLTAILGKLGAHAYIFFVAFILVSITSAIVSFHFRRKHFWYMRRRSKERRQLDYFSNLMVNKDLVKEIRLFGLSDLFTTKYQEVFKNYFKGIKDLIIKEGVCNIILSLCTAALNASLFYLIATNVTEIGNYNTYTAALNSISSCVATIISTLATIYEGSLFIDNLILFMNEKKTIKPSIDSPAQPQRRCGHKIEFKNVSFSYPGTTRKVLNNINVTINAGESCVLVGLNGAGKTTLIKLLTRLYDPTEGEILLDDRNIKEYDVESLYKIYGIIFQDFGKYAFSVKENIAFGNIDKSLDMQSIENAAVQSSSEDFISKLPNGYDTPLMRIFESNGIELSIGQWQKLSIARAFYSDSDILILDEPTASLDPMAEQEIYNQFEMLRKGKTTIFVSHRLSSATIADKIIVLKYGEIIEIGTHDELMSNKGEYYDLFSTQAKHYFASKDKIELND